MIQRTIAAVLLAGLAAPVLAGSFASPAYQQAQGLAGGESAAAVYDLSATKGAAPTQDSTVQTGAAPAVATPASVPATERASATGAAVPAPTQFAAKPNIFSKISTVFAKRGVKLGAAGAVIGAVGGGIAGGPIGAVIGALAGFAIGFLLSKVLRKH
ncbi:MAG: hypothetical protein ACHQ49_04930 [Elusimicrobiota bacterium]